MQTSSRRDLVALAAALLGPLAACAVLSVFRDSMDNTDAALILVLVVLAVAANGSWLSGTVAAVSAGIWFDFFLTEPYLRFTINDPEDVETALLLLVVGLLATAISVWGRRRAETASRLGDTSRPMVLAVLGLMTGSYLVGAWTGRSAGFSPFRMRSM